MNQPMHMPNQADLMWPTLRALEGLGGSGSNSEIAERIAADLGLADKVLDVMHGKGPRTEFDYRCAWARTRLRRVGAVDSSQVGVWRTTEAGRRIESANEVRALEKRERAEYRSGKGQAEAESEGVGKAADDLPEEQWKADLLGTLRDIDPSAFERLCCLLLREQGFKRVEVTGRSGDGGIDGTAILRLNNLLSFHVSYQCKRYAGTVGPGSIRDFRGALAGRADKGLLITTGTFTREAKREAVREGAMAIDLIDGNELCSLLRDKNLGTVTEMIERVTVDRGFFEGI